MLGGGSGILAAALWQHAVALTMGLTPEAVQQFLTAAKLLADPNTQRRLQHQLEQLAGSEGRQEPLLLTADRLRYNCLPAACLSARQVHQQLTAELKTAIRSAALAMLQLEPDNPKSHVGVAEAARLDPTGHGHKQAVQSLLRGFELAQQQGSDVSLVTCADDALHLATLHPLEVGQDAMAAAVAAFEQAAGAALGRCKSMLPEV